MKDITAILEADKLAQENLRGLMRTFSAVPCSNPVVFSNCRQWLVKAAVRRYRKAERASLETFNKPLAGALAGVLVNRSNGNVTTARATA